jgi:cellulose synthase/poly-beta-1,6-N-acetylglucosamine synthase-like glycosyltransferase
MVENISFLIFTYSGIYLLFSLIIALGEKKVNRNVIPFELPSVSIVICARNEEKNIRRCIKSLAALDYPKDRLEIFLVDDESEDSTLQIMHEMTEDIPFFRVLSTEGAPKDFVAKQRPLNLGISQSKGDIVFITDADIEVQPGWIYGHLTAYDEKIGIVGGCTAIDTSSGKIFDYLQSSDLCTKHAVAMGCCGLGFPLTIMGNNISFRRDAYDSVGGLGGLASSIVEDMALMNAVVKRTPYTLNWIADKRGVVLSLPEKNFDTFITQRLRWVHEVTDLSIIGKLMISMESLMVLFFFASIALLPYNPMPVLVCFTLWTMGYMIMLMPSPSKRLHDIFMLPGMLIFQLVYTFVSIWRKFFVKKKVVWKGRIYN